MKEITLTQNKIAIIDDEDYTLISKLKWHYSGVSKNYGRAKASNGVTMHRYILGAAKGQEVDHINGNPLDNRRCNLRLVTHAENQKNMKMHADNKTGYKGVSWHARAKKWQAHIRIEGKGVYLGVFSTKEEAAQVYNQAAEVHFREFMRK